MLDNYKTDPYKEINKIFAVLNRKYGFTKLWDALNGCFMESVFNSVEPSLDDFYKNFIVNNDYYENKTDFEVHILQYRLLVELLLELLKYPIPGFEYGEFSDDVNQLESIIGEGLKKLGYGIKEFKGKKVTYKIDIAAETIASENHDYSDDIFDFLIAKSTEEKESALTSLSIKLEAVKPLDGFMKNSKDYLQMMRHKEERKKIEQYSWFYAKEQYNQNLNDLFTVLVTYAAHIKCSPIIEKYDSKCHKK